MLISCSSNINEEKTCSYRWIFSLIEKFFGRDPKKFQGFSLKISKTETGCTIKSKSILPVDSANVVDGGKAFVVSREVDDNRFEPIAPEASERETELERESTAGFTCFVDCILLF